MYRVVNQYSVMLLLLVIGGAYTRPSPPTEKLNSRIVIGILDQPIINQEGCDLRELGSKYLVASYVKLIESVGARVVPIPFDAPKKTLKEFFEKVNGILLPGGATDFTPGSLFYDNSKYLYDLAIEANDAGDYFPLFGICQGMEMLAVMMADSNCEVLDFDFEASDVSLPLNYTAEAAESLLFKSMPKKIFEDLGKNNVTYNVHSNGLPYDTFMDSPSLSKMAVPLAINLDDQNKEFVSIFEGRKYPIWGIQFHPSRLSYEWLEEEDMDHSIQAVLDMQHLAFSMYGQARYNSHSYPKETLQKELIWNYIPYYTEPGCPIFQQTYIFDDFTSMGGSAQNVPSNDLPNFPQVSDDEL